MDTYSHSGEDILDKYDSLELDNNKVHEVVQFLKDALQRLARDCVITSGTHLADNSLVS